LLDQLEQERLDKDITAGEIQELTHQLIPWPLGVVALERLEEVQPEPLVAQQGMVVKVFTPALLERMYNVVAVAVAV